MLADAVLAFHMLVVLFNLGGLFAIVVGGLREWKWIRHRGFRISHLSLVALVALEALFGITCPLTALEDALRARETTQTFIGRLMIALIYYDAPPWAFTAMYTAFLGLVWWAWRRWPAKS
ncbi:MAG: DUF2784 domain-containing protein [Betaproteobacteria bacterium]|nr:DUF2784 domain-containing protein [Betaproteobacteria bacterium]